MSRPVRTVSPTGMYHIVVRGLDGIRLFSTNEEYEFFLKQMNEASSGFQIYAYCLQPNEIQLCVWESEKGTVPELMRRLLTRYAGWYNRKYDRRGAVTDGRYLCAPVLSGDESELIRFIHQSAGNCFQYAYSSFPVYEQGKMQYPDTWFEGDVISFHRLTERRDFTIRPSGKLTAGQVKEQVERFCRERGIFDWKQMPKSERDEALRILRERFSIGQIQEATGLSRSIVARCTVRKEPVASPSSRQMESFLL